MDSPECPESGIQKICLVCGDKALGYNFNAITCESCKAFFRRNALKDKNFKCPFNKKCEINTITRRFCQLCRLIKCFEIGMRKEHIMSESDKKEKRKNIEQKRAGRAACEEDGAGGEQVFEEKQTSKRIRTDEKKFETRLNPLSLASSCNNPYQNRTFWRSDRSVPRTEESSSEYDPPNTSFEMSPLRSGNSGSSSLSNSSHLEQASFPLMSEPSSPVGSAVVDVRAQFDSSRSRSAEIYQMSKVSEPARIETPKFGPSRQSSIIKNILSADQSAETSSQPADCRATNERSYEEPPSPKSRPMPLLASLVSGNTDQSRRAFRPDIADEILRDIPSRKSRLDLGASIESILSEAIKLEYEAYSSMNPRINSRELNDAERAKLNELIVANKALLAPVEDDVTSLMAQEAMSKSNLGVRPMLVDVLNLTAVAIRRLIKMSKKVNAFKNMCQEDQVALLKGGCTEMMILRSAMTYDSDRGSWKIPHSTESLMNIKVDVLKEAGGRVFEEHQRFLQTFEPRWRNDENIMLILSAITLFTPDRPRVVHYDVIKLEQNSYYYLLRRYLESIYPGCEARSTFLKLIHKIAELHRLNEDHVRVYMELNPEDVEPLLIEIFDLNPH